VNDFGDDALSFWTVSSDLVIVYVSVWTWTLISLILNENVPYCGNASLILILSVDYVNETYALKVNESVENENHYDFSFSLLQEAQ